MRYAASDLDLHYICITKKTLCLIHGLNQLLNFCKVQTSFVSIFDYKINNNDLCTMWSSSPPIIILFITADVAAVH